MENSSYLAGPEHTDTSGPGLEPTLCSPLAPESEGDQCRLAVLGDNAEVRRVIADLVASIPRFDVVDKELAQFEAENRAFDRAQSVPRHAKAKQAPTAQAFPEVLPPPVRPPFAAILMVVDRSRHAVVSLPPFLVVQEHRVPIVALRVTDPADDQRQPDQPDGHEEFGHSDTLEWPRERNALLETLALGLSARGNQLVTKDERSAIIRSARIRAQLHEQMGAIGPTLQLAVVGKELLLPSSHPPALCEQVLTVAHRVDPDLVERKVSALSNARGHLLRLTRRLRSALNDTPGVDARTFPVAPYTDGLALLGAARGGQEASLALTLSHAIAGVRPIENLTFIDAGQHARDTHQAVRICHALRDHPIEGLDVAVSGDNVYLAGSVQHGSDIARAEAACRRVSPPAKLLSDLEVSDD